MPRRARDKKRFGLYDVVSTKKEAETITKKLKKSGFDISIRESSGGIPFIISPPEWKIYARKK